MNVIPATSYGCGKCGRIYLEEKVAENCCVPAEAICKYCGKPVEHSPYKMFHYHDECNTKHLLDNAEIVPFQEGIPVFDPYSEKFRYSLEDLIEDYEDAADPVPEFCFATKEKKWKGIDLDRIIDQAREDFYSEDDDYPTLRDFVDLAEAEEFVAKWNAKQTISTFLVDRKKKIKIR